MNIKKSNLVVFGPNYVQVKYLSTIPCASPLKLGEMKKKKNCPLSCDAMSDTKQMIGTGIALSIDVLKALNGWMSVECSPPCT